MENMCKACILVYVVRSSNTFSQRQCNVKTDRNDQCDELLTSRDTLTRPELIFATTELLQHQTRITNRRFG